MHGGAIVELVCNFNNNKFQILSVRFTLSFSYGGQRGTVIPLQYKRRRGRESCKEDGRKHTEFPLIFNSRTAE